MGDLKGGDLAGGITRTGEGLDGVEWNILGQRYLPKSLCDSSFAFEANTAPGQSVPVHVHPTQDEFILVQEGTLDLKLGGEWSSAKAGDLIKLPRGVPHGYFNRSDAPVRALFWVSPAGRLADLFATLHDMTDVGAVVAASAAHDVDFLPPEANA